MKDCGKNIRKCFYDLIAAIPYSVYDEFTDDESKTAYVLLSTQTEDDASNKKGFVTNGTILIDVVTKHSNTINKETAENMADNILNAIKPQIGSKLTDSANEFQFINIKRLSANTLLSPTQTGYLLRKLLRFSFTAVEI